MLADAHWTGDWPPDRDKTAPLHDPRLYRAGKLNLEDRKHLVEQAILLLDEVYAHRELKRTVYGADPVRQLKALRRQLDKLTEKDLKRLKKTLFATVRAEHPLAPEVEFHRAMNRIFASLRDRHTLYFAARPFSELIAFLPFDVEKATDDEGLTRYVVTRVRTDIDAELMGRKSPDGEPCRVQPGWQVELWNGTLPQFAVERIAAEHAGSNPAARMARGLERLTHRPLAVCAIPTATYVTVRFLTQQQPVEKRETVEFQWLVTRLKSIGHTAFYDVGSSQTATLGLDFEVERLHQYRRQNYADKHDSSQDFSRKTNLVRLSQGGGQEIEVGEDFKEQLAAWQVCTRRREKVGYLRIYSFLVGDGEADGADAFLKEVARLLEHEMPKDGLIIDVRGNGGGMIPAAEYLLQLLTPRRIEPAPFQFRLSPLTEWLIQCAGGKDSNLEVDLSAWRARAEWGATTGMTYTPGAPISSPEKCNAVGQVYHGPVVLVIDANSYSATDVFIAGFQDHDIGPVIGTDRSSGAGGANVWGHGFLKKVLEIGRRPDPRLESLARGSDLRFAIRRSLRVGRHAGMPLEDLGVTPDYVYAFTERDLLEANQDLIEHTAEFLETRQIVSERRKPWDDSPPPRLVRLHPDEPSWPEPVARRLELAEEEVAIEEVEIEDASGGTGNKRFIELQVRTVGIQRVDVYVAGRPEKSVDVAMPDDDEQSADVEEPAGGGETVTPVPGIEWRSEDEAQVELRGYARQRVSWKPWEKETEDWRLVAARRLTIEPRTRDRRR